MEQLTGSKFGKEYVKVVYCPPAYLIYIQSALYKCQVGWLTSWNQECWKKYQQPQISRWHHPNGRKWSGTKEPLDEGEREAWKSWLKTQHSKTKIMASSPITSWQIDREKWKLSDFIFLGSKILADSNCGHAVKRHLLFGRKAMTSVSQSRDIALLKRSI